MAIIEIAVGKSKYKIECPEEEQLKLLHLAQKLDERVKKLLPNFKNIDEKTLLIIAGITLEDDLEARSEALGDNSAHEKLDENDMYSVLSENVENVAEYIENLAKKIENF